MRGHIDLSDKKNAEAEAAGFASAGPMMKCEKILYCRFCVFRRLCHPQCETGQGMLVFKFDLDDGG